MGIYNLGSVVVSIQYYHVVYDYMGVSIDEGAPKWFVYNGKNGKSILKWMITRGTP